MRENAEHALMLLLRAGLWERPIETVAPFPLTETEWEEVLEMARRQTVAGIVAKGLEYLPETHLPPVGQMARWALVVDGVERRNERMNQALESIYRGVQSCGFTALLLKGQGVAAYYASPTLRDCGDIDLYFPSEEEHRRFAKLLQSKGVKVRIESDRSFCYTWKGVVVEQHPEMLDVQAPAALRFLKGMETGRDVDEFSLNGRLKVKRPVPVLQLLLQSSHILKHLLGRGVGLRQFCDLARSYAVLDGQIDGEQYRMACRSLGLLKWNELLHAFLVEELGLPEECLPYPRNRKEKVKALKARVMRDGNFGQYAGGMTSLQVTGWKRKWITCSCFLKNAAFALRYAPAEAMWTVFGLFRGAVAARQ